jgi:hypothetical protein
MERCPIQMKQYSIFYSGDDNHVVRILPYINFVVDHMNKVAFLFNMKKGQQVSFQPWKIEYIVKKKIWESKQLNLEGSHSRRFET